MIVFGSAEANAIRDRDRKLAVADDPVRRAKLQEELRVILAAIEELEMRVADLEEAADEVRAELGEAATV